MKQRRIEKKLKRYAIACQGIQADDREIGIQELLGSKPVPCEKGTVLDFILEQIGYLGRYCLVWQGLWVVLFCYLMQHGMPSVTGRGEESETLVLISLLTPLLVLLTVEEITKIYQRSMLEIEYATKYSLRDVVLVRMLALCALHSLVLIVCVVCLHTRLDTGIGQLLIYGFTPMILATGILWRLMQYCQGETVYRAMVGCYAFLAAIAVICSMPPLSWYRQSYFKIWRLAFAVGIVFDVREFFILKGKLGNYEAIVRQ